MLAEQSARNYLSAVLPGEVIALTNVERSTAGDSQLTENPALALAAQNKANDMAAKGYFSHTGPDGKEPWVWIKQAGYSYQYAGENLAVRFDESADVVRAWMASPTHRANIVKPVYTEIGIGTANGMYEGSPATFVVQYFGTPIANSKPTAINSGSSAVSRGGNAAEPELIAQAKISEVAGAETDSGSAVTPTPTTSPVDENVPTVTSASVQDSAQPMREAAQVFLRANEASGTTVSWILGGIASLLILLLTLAFFIHIEIQPGQMLAGGAVVGLIAVSLFMVNGALMESTSSRAQSASAVLSGPSVHSVFIGEDGASTEQGDSVVAPAMAR